MLDLNEVATFVQVARHGSFAEAARRMRLPSATVSRHVQQLEERLGTRLMQRTTRKLTLTSAGVSFHQSCGSAVEALINAGQMQVAGSREACGLVRIAAPASFFRYFKMDWVSDFLRDHPQVRVEFALSDGVVDLISERIDIAFRLGPLRDSSHVARSIFSSYGGLLASPSYLRAHPAPKCIGELGFHECLTQPPDTRGYAIWRLQDQCGNEEDVRVRGRFVSNSLDALRRAACAGLGIAALPSILATQDIAAGRLLPVLPEYVRTGRGLSILFTSRQQVPRAVEAFAQMAVEKLSQQERIPASHASLVRTVSESQT